MEPNITLNWVKLPFGDFNARLIGLRLAVAPTARLGFGGLTQFNPTARTLTSSARMRWEYTPGSELFVVYSDGRDTGARNFPASSEPVDCDKSHAPAAFLRRTVVHPSAFSSSLFVFRFGATFPGQGSMFGPRDGKNGSA